MSGVAFSVFDGAYEAGAAVLLNSLVHAGWQGRIHLVHAGPRPAWAPGGDGDRMSSHGGTVGGRGHGGEMEGGVWRPVPGLEVVVEALPEGIPLCRWRVAMAQRLLPSVPAGGLLAYFDADIVVKAPAAWFGAIGHGGLCVVEDLHGKVDRADPRRVAWGRRLEAWGHPVRRHWDTYVNSGFFALRPGTDTGAEQILGCWSTLLDRAEADGVALDRIKRRGEPQPEWHIVDQDLLNAALMATDAPVELRPARDMDFHGTGSVMAHAVEKRKPWRRGILLEALKGWPPTPADLPWWEHADGPARPFSAGEHRRRRRAVRLAAWIARWYRRH